MSISKPVSATFQSLKFLTQPKTTSSILPTTSFHYNLINQYSTNSIQYNTFDLKYEMTASSLHQTLFSTSNTFTRAFSTCNTCNHETPASSNMKSQGNDSCGTSSHPKCWSCPVKLSAYKTLFCKHCGCLQPPVKQDHFALFNILPSFDVDLSKLEATLHSLQLKVHPDRFCARSEKEQTYSLAHAAELNSSYTTLRDPLSRARYILSLRAPSLLSEEKTVTDPMLLMDVLELREEMEDTDDTEVLFRIYDSNLGKKADLVAQLSVAFASEDYVGAVALVDCLSYYYSMDKELLTRIPGEVFTKHGCTPVRCNN